MKPFGYSAKRDANHARRVNGNQAGIRQLWRDYGGFGEAMAVLGALLAPECPCACGRSWMRIVGVRRRMLGSGGSNSIGPRVVREIDSMQSRREMKGAASRGRPMDYRGRSLTQPSAQLSVALARTRLTIGHCTHLLSGVAFASANPSSLCSCMLTLAGLPLYWGGPRPDKMKGWNRG